VSGAVSVTAALHEDELHWSPDGCAALGGRLLASASQLDAMLRDLGRDFGADECRFPSMIAAAALAPAGYLKSFPHHATFAASASRDREVLATLAKNGACVPIPAESLEPVSHMLTPAACYHFYPRLAGRHLDQPLYLTTACQCHRREDRYEPLRRQWCFWMREIVCIGSRDTVEHFAARCQSQIDTCVRRLDLAVTWQTAADSFFDPAHDPKALAQMVEPSKLELCLPDGLAIASVNSHRSFFGECYGIRVADDAAHSACVAFGIERWLFALLARHGANPADWPSLDVPS
jgi:seryl-tRNA synthetase